MLVGGTTCTRLMLTELRVMGSYRRKGPGGGEAVREGPGAVLALGQTPEDKDPCSHGQ